MVTSFLKEVFQIGFKNAINDLEILHDEVISTRHNICKFNGIDYTSDDTRMICMSSIQKTIITHAHIFNLQVKNRTSPIDVIPKYSIDIFELDEFIGKSLKNYLLVDVCFFVDAMLSTILDFLEIETHTSVIVNFNKLLDTLEISSSKKEYYQNVIKTLAYMRNSNHNNGINKRVESTVIIKNKSFVFEKGKVVENFSWDKVLVLIKEVVSVLDKVLTTETKNEINNLKIFIPDSFNEQTT